MKRKIKLIWQCEKCNDKVTSYSDERWTMNTCKCGLTSVDLEEWYQRNTGKVKEIKRYKMIYGKWVEIYKV